MHFNIIQDLYSGKVIREVRNEDRNLLDLLVDKEEIQVFSSEILSDFI